LSAPFRTPNGQITGFDEIYAQLKAMGPAVGGQALRQATFAASLPALRQVQISAPVGTRAHRSYKKRLVLPGFLKAHIRRMSFLSHSRTQATVLIGPSQSAFYAKFIELGKKGYPRRPFIEPAFKRSRQQMLYRLRVELTDRIDKAIK